MAPLATPVPLPSQMQRWNQSGATAGPSRVVQESPTRPRFGEIANNEYTRKPVVETRNLPSGFQPSASPTKSRVTDLRKGEGKATDLNQRGPLQLQSDSGPPPASLSSGGAQPISFQSARDDGYDATAQGDVFMADSNMDVNFGSQDDVEMTDGAQDLEIHATVDEEFEEMEPHRWIVDVSL